MKVFRSIKAFLLSIWHSMFFKYAVVCILGVLIVGFLDENSFWSHMKNRQRINELQEETAKYNAEFRRDQARIRFVLSDDDREIKGVVGDETAE